MPKTKRTTESAPRWYSVATVFAEVARCRPFQVIFVFITAIVGIIYSLLLPFKYTQHFSFNNWGYLSLRIIAFSIAYGLAFGGIATLQLYATNQLANRAKKSGPTTTLGIAASVVSCLGCCSPLVPSLLGIFGLTGISLLTTSIPIERFLATKESLLLSGGLMLLVLSGIWSAKRLAQGSCLFNAGICSPSETEVVRV